LLETEGKRKSEDVLASAAAVWPLRVEQMVKEVRPDCLVVRPIFFASRCGGRNRVWRQPQSRRAPAV